MTRFQLNSLVFLLNCVFVAPAVAGPAEDASAIVGQWTAAFNAGEVDRLVAAYLPDASVHGTTSADLAVGVPALTAYFAAAARARTQVKLVGDPVATVASDTSVALAGFYEFSGTRPDGQAFTAPARYSFLVVQRDGIWRIAHQHSSPRPRPAQ